MSIALIPVLLATAAIEASFDAPTFDRWNYPYNATPGSRNVGSTFSAYGSPYNFDDRDGQVLVGFATGSAVEDGLEASAYRIVQCAVTISIASDDVVFDSTPDDRASHEADGPGDSDPGRPVHLSGVAFRNDFDGWSFGEDGPFGNPDMGHRNCYPIDFDAQGVTRDLASNLTDGFDPNFFAIGDAGVAQGALIPQYGVLTFEVDVDDADIQCYLRTALAQGLVEFMISSLHPASEPGGGGSAIWPDWILKENVLVDLGYADAATLSIELDVVEPSGVVGDVTGDSLVDVQDLLAVLEAWGRCPCCATDLNGDGFVNVDEVLAVIAAWG